MYLIAQQVDFSIYPLIFFLNFVDALSFDDAYVSSHRVWLNNCVSVRRHIYFNFYNLLQVLGHAGDRGPSKA